MSIARLCLFSIFFFQAEDGIRDGTVTGVQTCSLPIWNEAQIHRQVDGALQSELDRQRRGGEAGEKARLLLRADQRLDDDEGDERHERSEERRVGKECRIRW